MSSYDSFGSLYDVVVGERPELARFICSLAKRYAPHARTLLELGCGSGSLLAVFRELYECTGIDISKEMIRIARRKARGVVLSVGDITRFELERGFDVIVCAFDTMNHLRSPADWRRVFRNAARHLEPGGVFIFDMNTAFKLDRYHDEPPVAEKKDGLISIVDVRRLGHERGGLRRYLVELSVFQPFKTDLYRRRVLEIPELVVPTDAVVKMARRYFGVVSVLDPDRTRPGRCSEELFFVCRKPFDVTGR